MFDSTIHADISPYLGPCFQNASRISDNHEHCEHFKAAHVDDNHNYSRAQLISLKMFATAYLASQVITSLKQQGLFRAHGVCSGNLV